MSEKPHIEVLAPDLIFMRITGQQDASKMAEVAETFRTLAEKSRFYLIADFSEFKLTNLDAKVRQDVPNFFRPEWILGCAYINASTMVKLSIKTINLGMFLVGRADYSSEFVSSEAEALAVIEKMRRERAKAATA